MNQKSNKLTVPDLISVGVFTALYFVLVTVATFACALLPGVGNILLPAVAALISGSVYMLLARQATKIRRHHDHGPCDGPVLLRLRPFCAVVRGQHHLRRRGRPGGRCGQIPQQKAAAGQLRRVFLCLTGPILPLWFMKSAYIANLTARGKDTAYIDTLFAPINSGSFVVSMLAILICALVGGFFGQKMLKKHFEKAGIVA